MSVCLHAFKRRRLCEESFLGNESVALGDECLVVKVAVVEVGDVLFHGSRAAERALEGLVLDHLFRLRIRTILEEVGARVEEGAVVEDNLEVPRVLEKGAVKLLAAGLAVRLEHLLELLEDAGGALSTGRDDSESRHVLDAALVGAQEVVLLAIVAVLVLDHLAGLAGLERAVALHVVVLHVGLRPLALLGLVLGKRRALKLKLASRLHSLDRRVLDVHGGRVWRVPRHQQGVGDVIQRLHLRHVAWKRRKKARIPHGGDGPRRRVLGSLAKEFGNVVFNLKVFVIFVLLTLHLTNLLVHLRIALHARNLRYVRKRWKAAVVDGRLAEDAPGAILVFAQEAERDEALVEEEHATIGALCVGLDAEELHVIVNHLQHGRR